MDTLSTRERELVALGAALASNCVPCIEYHVPEARRAGLTDQQIGEAIRLAEKVRQVPARKVLDTALGLLANDASRTGAGERRGGCGQSATGSGESATGSAPAQPCCG